MGDVLQLIIDGISVPDLVMKKTCAHFFCELINQWGGCQSLVPPNMSNASINFAHNALIPGMLTCALDPVFNIKDALNCRVLAEFGRALWFLKLSRRGDAKFQCHVIDNLILRGHTWGRKGFPGIASGFQSATCEKDVELMLKAWKEELARQ